MFNKVREEQTSHSDLDSILSRVEPDEQKRQTVLGIYDALASIKEKYFDSYSSILRKKDGLLVITGYEKARNEPPKFKLNGFDATAVAQGYSVWNGSGRQKLEELLYHNGAVEVDSKSGDVKSYRRHIHVDIEEAAAYMGKPLTGDGLGFDEKERRKLGGRNYAGVGTRHMTAITSTGVDPDLYIGILSRQTGAITIFHQGKILYSSIRSEIAPEYKPRESALLAYAPQTA